MTLLLELTSEQKDNAKFAVARRAAGAPGGVESWDLMILDADGNEISKDPFSFSGDFIQGGGLSSLVVNLLNESGLVYRGSQAWRPNADKSEWRAEVGRIAAWFKPST